MPAAHNGMSSPSHAARMKANGVAAHSSLSSSTSNGNALSNKENATSSDYEFDMSAPTEVHRVPSDQVTNLSEEQKNEVFTKVIAALDPNVTKGITRFDYAEGVYRPVNSVSHLVVHFSLDGLLLHNESDEAKEQASWIEANQDRMLEFRSTGTDTANDQSKGPESSPPMSPSNRQMKEEESKTNAVAPEEEHVNDRALKNQFNYSERGNQTVNPTLREREVATEPPPCVDFSGQVTHHEIWDTYCEHLEKEQSMREAKEKPKKKTHDDDEDETNLELNLELLPVQEGSDASASSPSSASALNAILHTTTQHLQRSAANSASNSFAAANPRAGVGKLDANAPKSCFLPLWKFSFVESLSSSVTAISFNPLFNDLFAVAYGSFEFGAVASRSPGLVAAFTLKNSTYPEYVLHTPAAVQCLDWHPQHASLLAVGMIDGSVAVYDIRQARATPEGGKKKPALLYLSDSPRTKHTDCVWQVRWSPVVSPSSSSASAAVPPAAESAASDSGSAKPLSFFSISADGRVTQWTLNKQELQCEDVLKLTVKIDDSVANAGGTCFAFSSHVASQFLVGTEEGAIHLYDRAFHTTLLRSFQGHHASIYALHFNAYHPGVFLSCSADWQVRVWEIESSTAAMAFDLTGPIGDVSWSPHSATMFAVVTSDGRLRVYDLAINKYEAIGEMRVNKRVALTHVVFSPVDPTVAVGDAEGKTHLLKLGSGLRRKPWPVNGGKLSQMEALEEVRRLDRLLVLPSREDGKQPAYIRNFIAQEERRQAGEAKAKAEMKAAQEKAKAAAASPTSPLTSPRKAAD